MLKVMLQVAIILFWSGAAMARGHDDSKVFTGVVNDDIFTSGESVDIDGDVAGDIFAAGGVVSLAGTAGHQAVVAGGQVSVKSAVAGDVLAAGGTVNVSGPVGYNLVVAGGNVTVSGPVAGKVVATGAMIEIGREAVVEGSGWLGGGRVLMKGHIKHDLNIAAGKAIIFGEVEGNVTVEADSLVVEPGARIAGSLTFKGPKAPVIDKGAVVLGAVKHVPQAGFSQMGKQARNLAIAFAFVPLLMLLVTGLILIFAVPGYVGRVSGEMCGRPLASIGLGGLLAFGLPAVVVALMVTIVAIPIGLIVLALYVVGLLLAVPLAGIGLSRMILARAGKFSDSGGSRLLLSLVYLGFLILLGLLGWLPLVGGLLWTVILCFGYGAGVLALWAMTRACREARAQDVAPTPEEI